VPKRAGAKDSDHAEQRQELEEGLKDVDASRVVGEILGDGEGEENQTDGGCQKGERSCRLDHRDRHGREDDHE